MTIGSAEAHSFVLKLGDGGTETSWMELYLECAAALLSAGGMDASNFSADVLDGHFHDVGNSFAAFATSLSRLYKPVFPSGAGQSQFWSTRNSALPIPGDGGGGGVDAAWRTGAGVLISVIGVLVVAVGMLARRISSLRNGGNDNVERQLAGSAAQL
jgi:hypothetical protein